MSPLVLGGMSKNLYHSIFHSFTVYDGIVFFMLNQVFTVGPGDMA